MVDHVSQTNYVGQQFGNYRLLRVLSVGKDSTLYLGEHVYLKTPAAIKLYHGRLLQNDQESFLAEASLLAHLVHPHIARVLEGGIERDMPFLVIAYTSAGTLRMRYPVGAVLPLPVIISYVKQLAAALDYVHSQKVLHLDIKPENIWIHHNNDILLSNFRITLFSHSSRSESVKDIFEAVTYMAPEQIQGHASPASDQYMVGILVYEWLCGSRPFLSTNYVEIAQQHLHTQPPALSSKVPGLAPAVEQVIMKALSKDGEERFPTMQAFADALEQSYLAPWNIAPPPAFVTKRSHISLSTSVEETPPPTIAKHNSMRRRVTLGLAGFAGAAALATAGGMIWFSRPVPSPKPKSKPAKAMPIGTTLHTYQGHVDSVYGVAWARDGQNIASWSRDDTMQVWNTTTFAQVYTNTMTDVLAWSPDWQFMVSGNMHDFQVWEVATGHIMLYYNSSNTGGGVIYLPVNYDVQWSPNGKYISSVLDAIHVWDVTTNKMLFSYPPGPVAWSPDGKRIALYPRSYSPTNTPVKMQIVDVATENQLASYIVSIADVSPLVWSPNGKFLLSGNDVLDATTGKHIATYKGPQLTMVWSPNSQHLAAFNNSENGSRSFNQQLPTGTKVDTTVHIWNALTGEDVFVYHGHTAGVNDVAWSPGGSKIASASADTTVKVWQAT